MCENLPLPGGQQLPPGNASLAHGVPAAAPGTIYARTVAGGVAMRPGEGRTILFGRNRPEVHVCLGENDPQISRRHGQLVHYRKQWWLSTSGRRPMRLPGARLLHAEDDPIPLAEGYTPLFVRGSGTREHLLELFVAGVDPAPVVGHGDPTRPPKMWRLTDKERLALVTLGQRYLRHDNYPQPLTWQQVADQLAELQPGADWNGKKVERLVTRVRTRMSEHGVAGLTREEIGEPVGNMLNHNLIRELMESTTLVPTDLYLLDHPGDER